MMSSITLLSKWCTRFHVSVREPTLMNLFTSVIFFAHFTFKFCLINSIFFKLLNFLNLLQSRSVMPIKLFIKLMRLKLHVFLLFILVGILYFFFYTFDFKPLFQNQHSICIVTFFRPNLCISQFTLLKNIWMCIRKVHALLLNKCGVV